MATIGVGYRTVQDVLIEISLRLVEDYVNTTITAPVAATGSQTVAVGSLWAIYVGAQLVIDSGVNAEVITITAVDTTLNTITAVFAETHLTGVILWGATFPQQQPTDPLFTQEEMLGYLARAQNEFLSQVPAFYTLFEQTILFGNIFQTLPATATQLDRVALSTVFIPITSLTRSGGEVTAVAPAHGLSKGSTPVVQGTSVDSFDGVFQIDNVIDVNTFTYPQFAADASATGGQFVYWLRLYEITMSELTMQNRNWRNDFFNAPSAFFEDRSGLYQWGVNANPSSNFPVQLLVATRDSDTLGFLDGFLVPDVCLHYVIYKAFEYIFSKDGVRIQPMLANYCKSRFERGVAVTNRYIDNMLATKNGRR